MTPLDRWEAAQDLCTAYHDPAWIHPDDVWSVEDSLALDAQIVRERRWAPSAPPPDPRLRQLLRDGNPEPWTTGSGLPLPATVRMVAQRCLDTGLTPSEVAQRMGVSEKSTTKWNVPVRVRKVRRMLADGWAVRAIAATLSMSPHTVERIRDDMRDDAPALFDIA